MRMELAWQFLSRRLPARLLLAAPASCRRQKIHRQPSPTLDANHGLRFALHWHVAVCGPAALFIRGFGKSVVRFCHDGSMSPRKRSKRQGILRQHSLSLTVAGIVIVWLVLYRANDPDSHLGAFYGNAIADWIGTFLLVVATKYCYEIGSAESRPPHPHRRGPLMGFLIDHSLTLVLTITGIAWALAYARLAPDGKTGQVVGNIVSEWAQILGIVIITKYTRELRSKESV